MPTDKAWAFIRPSAALTALGSSSSFNRVGNAPRVFI